MEITTKNYQLNPIRVEKITIEKLPIQPNMSRNSASLNEY